MTDFIESFATHQLLPPWTSKSATTYGFAVRLEEANVRAYLETYFNGGYPDQAPYQYAPLPGPQFGLLVLCDHPEAASVFRWIGGAKTRPEKGWDRVSNVEFYLAIPVQRRSLTPENLILDDPSIVWVQPFSYCNNASVVFSAREVWGTDMQYATINLEKELPPGRVHADVAFIGIKKFKPTSQNQLLALAHIRTGGASPFTLDEMLAINPDLGDFVKILSESGVFAGQQADASKDPDAGGIEMNNLKQFRAVHDMGHAIYRAIVATRSVHTEIDKLRFYDCNEVEVDFMWSDSIADELKAIFNVDDPNATAPIPGHPRVSPPLPTEPGATPREIDWDMDRLSMSVEFAFSFVSDVRFEVLRTLYTYGLILEPPAPLQPAEPPP